MSQRRNRGERESKCESGKKCSFSSLCFIVGVFRYHIEAIMKQMNNKAGFYIKYNK